MMNKDTDFQPDLLEVCQVKLNLESGHYPDIGLSIRKQRGYLITGPDEEANVLLLKIMGGLVPPGPYFPDRECRVFFQGIDIFEDSEPRIKQVRKKVAFVFHEGIMISNLTIRENLLLPYQYYSPDDDCTTALEKITRACQFFDIPDVLDKRPALVSYRVKKKLAFIRASLLDPDLILLDKPMFNLDEDDQEQVLDYLVNLKEQGITLVIVSRFQSILDALIDEAILLEKGQKPVFIERKAADFTALSRFTFHHQRIH